MLRFGGHVLGYNVVTYFGGTQTASSSGGPSAQTRWVCIRVPTTCSWCAFNIGNPLQQVGLPALSQLAEWPDRFARYYALGFVALFTVPIAAVFIIEVNFPSQAPAGS